MRMALIGFGKEIHEALYPTPLSKLSALLGLMDTGYVNQFGLSMLDDVRRIKTKDMPDPMPSFIVFLFVYVS